MPPRWISVAVVAFWLCTTGWLFYENVWPWLLPGRPPPYAVDLEDEVQQTHIPWTVFCNDRPFLRVETWVQFNGGDDSFDLHARGRPLAEAPEAGPFGDLIAIQEMNSVYRVSRRGELRSFSEEFTVEAHAGPIRTQTTDRKSVALSTHGWVFSPWRPLRRVAGLHPGQSWGAVFVDAFENAETPLTAAVRPQTETTTWNGRPVECIVIDYHGDDVHAATWVQVGSGDVLRQECERRGETLVVRRD